MNKIVETDIQKGEKQRYCKNCLTFNDYHVEGIKKVCYGCGGDMDALPDALVLPEDAQGSLTGANKAIVEPSIKDMQLEIAVIEKAIAELEKKRDKVISEKHNLLTNDGDYHSIESLHSKEKAITAELSKLSNDLVTKKQALQWKLADKENMALAMAEIQKYNEKKVERIEAGFAVANDIKSLIATIGQLAVSTKNFTPLQNKAFSDAYRICKNFRQWGISNLDEVSVDQIRNDTTKELREFKANLRKDVVQLNNSLQILQGILWDILHAIQFEMYENVERPPELPSY